MPHDRAVAAAQHLKAVDLGGIAVAAADDESSVAEAALTAVPAIVDVVGVSAVMGCHLLEYYYYHYSGTTTSDDLRHKLRLGSAAKGNLQAASGFEVFQVSKGRLPTSHADFLPAKTAASQAAAEAAAAAKALHWSAACALPLVATSFDVAAAPDSHDDEQREDHHLMIDHGDIPKKQEESHSKKWKCSIF